MGCVVVAVVVVVVASQWTELPWRLQPGEVQLVLVLVLRVLWVVSLMVMARGRLCGVVVVVVDEIGFRLSHCRFRCCCYLRLRPRLAADCGPPSHHQAPVVAASNNVAGNTTFALETMSAS